jgi:hypothetical protein
MRPNRLWVIPATVLVAAAMVAASRPPAPVGAASPSQHMALDCEYSSACAEVADSSSVFGQEYVGHDEPSLLFYSHTPGAGNRMQYSLTLPRDPSPGNPNAPGKSYQFELNGSFWFGMALCDTQSYPEQVSTCAPDSDRNIVDPATSAKHPGTAFMEMQFYPPGWVPWPAWQVAAGASGCDPTKWCAALNIDSLSENPVTGTTQNATCAAKAGLEYVNFAFITKNGVSQAPANPVDSTTATFTPDPAKDLFMNSGDRLQVSFRDTRSGLRVVIDDRTSGLSGAMTASAANGFGQVKYDPTGTSCTAIPYNFHPMYSTSSEQTRVIWAAHTYNVAFADEIGHFQTCNGPTPLPQSQFGLDASGNPITCPAADSEGTATGPAPPDGDDNFCFPGSQALLYRVNGCTDTNTGFDGASYQPIWPDGNTALHPQPILFGSPLTGPGYNVNYSRAGFEADLPRIETATCNRSTGAGCTLIPTTDSGTPAAFYPFFSALHSTPEGACEWAIGGKLPEGKDFGGNAQYGSLLTTTYLAFGGGGSTVNFMNNFRQIQPNPCRG